MKTRIQVNAIILAVTTTIFVFIAACGTREEYTPSYVETEPAEASDYEQVCNNETDNAPNGNENITADAGDTTILENVITAVPILLPVYVNEMLFSVPAFYVQGYYYFYLRDIAYILKDTVARFELSLHGPSSPSWWLDVDGERRYNIFSPIIWDAPYSPAGTELQPLTASAEIAVPIEFWFNNQSWLVGGVFGTSVSMDGFDINNRLYTDLWQIGQAVGFETIFNTRETTFRINTHEPFVSEYGRRVAREFMRPFLEDGVYYYERDYDVVYLVWGYRLYDFDGSGIPAVVLTWGRDISRWNSQTLYIYKPELGGYISAGDIGLHIFYRSIQSQDEMFLYSGDLGHYSGMFGSFMSVTVDGYGLHFQPLYSDEWLGWCDKNNTVEFAYHIDGVLADMDEETLAEFFWRLPILSNPYRLDEPLFPIRPFTFSWLEQQAPITVEHINRFVGEPFQIGNLQIVVSANFTVASCCGHYTANATLFPVTVTNIGTDYEYLSVLNIYGLGCLSGYPVPINHVYFEIPHSCIFMLDTSTQLAECALAPGMDIHFYLPIYASVCATLAWYRSFEFVEDVEDYHIIRHHYFDIRVIE